MSSCSMPSGCAPSMSVTIPFERASAASSFIGTMHPVGYVAWLTLMTLVRGVMASLNRFRMSAGLAVGIGILRSFSTTP